MNMDTALAQWMETRQEWILGAYSEEHTEPSIFRDGEPVYFNREEALAHACSILGVRTQQGVVGISHSLIELVGVYVEGDDEGGVIMGQWKIIETWPWKTRQVDV